MTISSTNRKAGPYAGNDVAVSFPFAFKVFAASDLYVVRADSDGAETVLALTANYTVTLNSDQNANPGGTITLPAALADGLTLTITSTLPYLQPVDLTNNGGFYPKVINSALDRLTIFVQQIASAIGASLKLGSNDTPGSGAYRAGGNRIADVGNPASPGDAINRGWLDLEITGVNTYTNSLYSQARSYAESLVSGVVGGYGYFIQLAAGAISRTFQDKMRESVSVLDFGADRTGQTSSTTAFQKAFDYAAITSASSAGPITTNLSVFVPAGLYYIDSTVSVDKRIGLYGEGANTVITGISPSTSFPATCGFRFNSPATTGIAPHIHHLTFFGFNGGPCISVETSGAMVESCFFSNSVSGVDLNSDSLGNAASDVILSSCIFDQMLADVRAYSAVNVSILGCQSFLSSYGLQFLSSGTGNSDFLISNCEFNYTKTSSITVDSSTNKNIQVSGCSFMLNQQHSSFVGFIYTGTSTAATELFVKNCTFRNWKDYAVRFYGTSVFVISDCIFDANKTVSSYTQSSASKAIVLTGCTIPVMVQNCQFRNIQNALIDGYVNSVCNLLHGAATNSSTILGNDGSCTLTPRGFISSSGNSLYGTQSDFGRPVQVKGQVQFGDSVTSTSTGVVLYENGSDSGILGYQNIPFSVWVNLTKSFIFNTTGSIHLVPLNSAPSGAIKGDVYYDNALNKMRAYDGVAWNNLF